MKSIKQFLFALIAFALPVAMVSCKDDPKEDPNAVTKISLTETTLSLEEGGTITITPSLEPTTSKAKISFTSDNEAVASVSQAGVITAVKAGTATITISATDKTATCTVTVTAKTPETPAVTSVTISKDGAAVSGNIDVEAGGTITLTASQSVKWTVEEGKGVTISDKGVVTIAATAAAGTVVITATYTEDSKVSAKVTINVTAPKSPVESIAINKDGAAVTEISVEQGQTQALTATVAPSGVAQTVTWSVDEGKGVSISADGVITVEESAAVGAKVNVMATSTLDENATATIVLTIAKKSYEVPEVTPTPTTGKIERTAWTFPGWDTYTFGDDNKKISDQGTFVNTENDEKAPVSGFHSEGFAGKGLASMFDDDDANGSSYWHSGWSDNADFKTAFEETQTEKWFILDLGAIYKLTGIELRSRDAGNAPRWKGCVASKFTIYVCTEEGKTAEGQYTWTDAGEYKWGDLYDWNKDNPIVGIYNDLTTAQEKVRYIKLVFKTSDLGKVWMGAANEATNYAVMLADLNLFGEKTGDKAE